MLIRKLVLGAYGTNECTDLKLTRSEVLFNALSSCLSFYLVLGHTKLKHGMNDTPHLAKNYLSRMICRVLFRSSTGKLHVSFYSMSED